MNLPAKKLLLFLFLACFGIATRFIPHPANFTAVFALSLFCPYLFSKKTALVLPLSAMLFSDIFLGFYQPLIMLSVYGSFLLCALLGFYLKTKGKLQTILTGSLLCGIIFFIISNGAVFLFTPWYSKNINGLWQCFFLGLPFFKNNLLGNLFYSGLLFSFYELLVSLKNPIFPIKEKRTNLNDRPNLLHKLNADI